MTEAQKRELPDDIETAEAIARADESRVEILRAQAAKSDAYKADLDAAIQDSQTSAKHVGKLRGEIEDAPVDLSGVTRGLSDSQGNFAANVDVLTSGGIGVEASNTNVETGEPAASADEAGTASAADAGLSGVEGTVGDPAVIPDNWREMSWQQKRSLASKFSDAPINNGDQADKAIEAELKRRS